MINDHILTTEVNVQGNILVITHLKHDSCILIFLPVVSYLFAFFSS